MHVPSQPLDARPASATPARFAFLDGLRGLAALYVVLHHAVLGALSFAIMLGARDLVATDHIQHVLILTNYVATGFGVEAVTIFIVLSGFVLMLPVAKTPAYVINGGLRGFFVRRARRILPPYYAAFGLGLGLIGCVPFLRNYPTSFWAAISLPAFTPGSIVSHLLIVHNWTPWITRTNPPLWSVAVEWQIYFGFALVLVPVLRRLGLRAAILTCLGIAIITSAAVTLGHHADAMWPIIGYSRPWMILPFGIGAYAALLWRSPKMTLFGRTARTLPWRWIGGASAGVFAALHFAYKVPGLRHLHLQDVPEYVGCNLIALTAASVILLLCMAEADCAAAPLGLGFLGNPVMVKLGAFSYSLYLVHAYVLWMLEPMLYGVGWSVAVTLLVYLGFAVPLALAASYLFHLLFERPFMPGHPRTLQGAAKAAIVSPAP